LWSRLPACSWCDHASIVIKGNPSCSDGQAGSLPLNTKGAIFRWISVGDFSHQPLDCIASSSYGGRLPLEERCPSTSATIEDGADLGPNRTEIQSRCPARNQKESALTSRSSGQQRDPLGRKFDELFADFLKKWQTAIVPMTRDHTVVRRRQSFGLGPGQFGKKPATLSSQLLLSSKMKLNQLSQIVIGGVEQAAKFEISRLVFGQPTTNAVTYNKKYPGPTPHGLGADHGQGADLGRRADVGTTACIEVEAIDLHQADLTGVSFREGARANTEGLHFVHLCVSDPHRMRREDLLRHRVLEPPQVSIQQRRNIEFDVARRRSKVKGRRRPSESAECDRGQQVLPGVLLHVIKSTSPVENLMNRSERRVAVQEVANNSIELLDIDDLDPAHGSPISGLPTTLGVEDRVGGDGEWAVIVSADLNDFGVELGEGGVRLIGESFHSNGV